MIEEVTQEYSFGAIEVTKLIIGTLVGVPSYNFTIDLSYQP